MIELAIEHDIHLYCLPPHTTHRLQPLDVGVFGPLQRRWEVRCDDIVELTGESIQIEDVVKEYLGVRVEAFLQKTILAAWTKAGIRPLNPSIFTSEDFAPSADTSTEAHLPSSFPTMIHSIPEPPTAVFEWENNFSDNMDDSDDSDADMDTSATHAEPAGNYNNSSLNPTMLVTSTGTAHTQEQDTRSMEAPTRNTNTVETRSMSRLATPVPQTSTTTKPIRSFTLLEAQNELRSLRAQMQELESRCETAEAHCKLAHHEISALKFRLNKRQKKKDRRFRSSASLLTSEEGRKEWNEERRRREEKQQEQEAAEAEKKKLSEARNIQRCTTAASGIFTGALKSKKKPELEDIAAAFGLSYEGTKACLMQRITDHMSGHPDLESNPRFCGLFAAQKRHGGNNRTPLAPISLPQVVTFPPLATYSSFFNSLHPDLQLAGQSLSQFPG